MRKLGLIAGGGDLPVTLAQHCRSTGRPVFVVRLRGFADPRLAILPGAEVGLAELGKGFAALRGAGCEAICLAGKVDRPDLRALKPDLRGLAALPGAIAAARRGDDALLAFMVREFEKEGFAVEGADTVMGALALRAGILGAVAPAPQHRLDIARAVESARAIGALDAGQAAVSCEGLILALEAQEGTDALLKRVAKLPKSLRGAPDARRGVLAKICKPGQELRVDLPTIGPSTIEHAAAAGLAGVVGEAGRLLVLDEARAVRLADGLGLFILGLDP